ncbi:MAG: hypothetical protein Q4E38_09810 [Eubacteriales bacterium]|nr:hypothetical protein [Eubacteriales bacterium]
MQLQLHNLIMEISLEPDPEWQFWRWKLDPFQCAPVSAAPDVRVVFSHESGTDKIGQIRLPVVFSEKNGFYTYTIYQAPDGSLFWCMDRPAKKQRIASFFISPEWTEIKLLEDYSYSNGQLPFELLSRMLPSVFLKHSIVQLHGVLLEDSGRGILICADSGIGKTTHARLWRDYRHSIIINGDRASCVKEKNGWTAFGIPWCGTSGEYMNRAVPIRAIVALERGEVNEAVRLSGIEAFFRVMSYLQYPTWEPLLLEKGMDLVQDLTESVPVICLRCKPDFEAVEILEKTIKGLEA